MYKNNHVRTFGSLITLVFAFTFLVAATPPSCSPNATVQYQDGGKTYSVKLTDLKQWATDQAISTGDARYQKIANMTGYVQRGDLASYVLSTTLTNYVAKSTLNTTLSGYATKSELAKMRDENNANLNAAAKKSDLTGLLTISQLTSYKTEVANTYATKEEVGIVSAAIQKIASALNLDDLVAELKGLFATKTEVADTYATKAEVLAMVASVNNQTLPTEPSTETSSGVTPPSEDPNSNQAYEYEPDPSFDPNNIYWYVDVTSKSQPTYSIANPTSDQEWNALMNMVSQAIAIEAPNLPAVNNTGKVNITLARNQVNGVTLGGTAYQAAFGLTELLKHGYDDNYFGIVKMTDGRYFVGKRNGNSVEVIYVNETSIEGTFISDFYSRVDCIHFSSDM